MAEFWEYDARLMRRWNTDPLAHAGQSLYEAFYSNPIIFSDPFGLKPDGGIQTSGPGGRKRKKNPDGSTTVTDGRTSWEYDKEGNNAGGDLGTGPMVTITPQTREEARQAEAAAKHVSLDRSTYHTYQRNRAWQDLRGNPGDDDAFRRLIKYQANIILGSDSKISHSEHKFVENVAKPTSEFIVDLHPATSVYNVANGYFGNGTDWTGEEMSGGVKAMEAGLIIFTIIPGGKTVVKTVTKTIRTVVKSDKRLLKLAKETFEGNDLLRKEANSLIEELATGNMNPGIGTKNIAKNIFEARSRNGARVYFRNVDNEIEIIGYSNKSNQQQVINRILELYTK